MQIASAGSTRAEAHPTSRDARIALALVAWQALAMAGVVLLLLGLGVDAWRHNSGASGEESLLSLRNPGHAIAGLGLALTAIGLLISISLSAARQAMVTDRALIVLAGAAVCWVIIAAVGAGTLAYIAASDTTVGHSHGETELMGATHPGAHDHAVAAGAHDHGAHPTFTAIMQGGDADLLPRFPQGTLAADDLPVLRAQLREAAASVGDIRTIEDAEAAGFRQTTTDVDAMGLHYLSIERVTDGVFDPARPEGLLFSRVEGTAPTLVGVWYLQTPGVGPVSRDYAPEGFAGKLDYWHGHKNVCLPFETEGGSEADCIAQGGRFVTDTRWMMHAWVVPAAGDNPDGVFAYLNSDLQARQQAASGGDPDSDGDGLRDSLELGYAHNPIAADSDADGVTDGRDADWLRTAVSELPEGALESIELGERDALESIVDEAAVSIAAGDIATAIDVLGRLRSRLDGCVLHSVASEWMRACNEQADARELIDLLVTNLGP